MMSVAGGIYILIVERVIAKKVNVVNKAELGKRKAFLGTLATKRNCRICHYTDALDTIEPGILPLVLALDTGITTPIYSCEGHWQERKEPYVQFVVLPGKESDYRRALSRYLEHAPSECRDVTIVHRHKPRRSGGGPFIDWKIVIDVPADMFARADAFSAYRARKAGEISGFLETLFWK